MAKKNMGKSPDQRNFLTMNRPVDGSEILRSKPVEVDSDSFFQYLQGFSTISVGCLGFLNHQQ